MAEQPKNFGFGEDETMLRDSARKFFEDHSTADKLHRLVAEDYRIDRPNECIWEPQLWQQMVELGWTAACVPEEAGGLGMPVVAAVALAEESRKSWIPLATTLHHGFNLCPERMRHTSSNGCTRNHR